MIIHLSSAFLPWISLSNITRPQGVPFIACGISVFVLHTQSARNRVGEAEGVVFFFPTRRQSEEERGRADDGDSVRHQKVQVFDYSHFLALPLSGIHSIIKSSFVLFPHPSPSQLIRHLMDALVIKTIIVIP